MQEVGRKAAWLVFIFVLAGALPALAQQAQPAVTLGASGTFSHDGSFTGTVTINRFEQQGNQIVAIGIVQGTLRRANRVIGTALAGEVAWPVKVSAAGNILAAHHPSSNPSLRLARWSPDVSLFVNTAAMQAQGCTPLQISLGATTINVLGTQVALDPVGLTLTGEAGTPLGDLVCAASNLLGNVAGLVNLLNNVLGVVTGLLGGLTGGLAGGGSAIAAIG